MNDFGELGYLLERTGEFFDLKMIVALIVWLAAMIFSIRISVGREEYYERRRKRLEKSCRKVTAVRQPGYHRTDGPEKDGYYEPRAGKYFAKYTYSVNGRTYTYRYYDYKFCEPEIELYYRINPRRVIFPYHDGLLISAFGMKRGLLFVFPFAAAAAVYYLIGRVL